MFATQTMCGDWAFRCHSISAGHSISDGDSRAARKDRLEWICVTKQKDGSEEEDYFRSGEADDEHRANTQSPSLSF